MLGGGGGPSGYNSSGGGSSGSVSSMIKNTIRTPGNYLRGRIVKKAAAVVDKYVTDLSQNAPYLNSNTKHNTSSSHSNAVLDDNNVREDTKAQVLDHGTEGAALSSLLPETIATIPLLERKELVVGSLLGEGGFCQVWEVTGVVLNNSINENSNETSTKSDDDTNPNMHENNNYNDDTDGGAISQAQREARQALAESSEKFAVKQLRKRLTKHPPEFTLAAADLVVEAQYLSRLSHPHIVKVRGMTMGGIHPMTRNGHFDAYFLVLDYLTTTLDRRIHAWQRGQEEGCTYQDKLQYALEIASALQYLHQRRIIFRDLKPQNIGFKRVSAAGSTAQQLQLQLFDFGLVRELPRPRDRTTQRNTNINAAITKEEEKREADHSDAGDEVEEQSGHQEEEDFEEDDLDDYYHMTRVGTRRYSAVEIHISGKYNEKVDVYSWAMTVYEMISLSRPFPSLTDRDHQEFVCAQGRRPNLKPFLQQCEQPKDGGQPPILVLMREAWEQYVRRRIDIHTVVERMEEIIHAGDAGIDKEKELANSALSVTTATAAESDHDDDERTKNNKEADTSKIQQNEGSLDDIANTTPTLGNGRKKVEKNESFELMPGEDSDLRSIQSLIVDIDGTSRHSGVTGPSGATVSGSEQTASSRWDDSINTASVGEMIGADASLSTVVFEEYLRPRQQRVESIQISGDAPASPLSTSDVASCGTGMTPPPNGLVPPLTSLTKPKASSLIRNHNDRIVPPQTLLRRIASCSLDEDAADDLDISLLPDVSNEDGKAS